jgi:hypothetical protein
MTLVTCFQVGREHGIARILAPERRATPSGFAKVQQWFRKNGTLDQMLEIVLNPMRG